MSGQIVIEYLYRDADNYKRHGTVAFANPYGLAPELLRQAFERAFRKMQLFPDVLSFDPAFLGWESLFFDGYDATGRDIGLHEIVAIEGSSEPVALGEDVSVLLQRLAGMSG